MTETATLKIADSLAVDEGSEPNRALLFGWFVVHVVAWIGLAKLLPGEDVVDYGDIGVLETPWLRQFIIPLVVVLGLQVAFVSRMGWWSSVMREPSRSSRKWIRVFPALLAVTALGRLVADGLSVDAGTRYLLGCAVTMALVGVTEELTFRGILQAAGRRLFAREWQAVLAASVLFGLFHTPNIVLGAEVDAALLQTVLTAVLGLGFYCLRRTTGSLVPCMILHAAYDFALIQGSWDTVINAAR